MNRRKGRTFRCKLCKFATDHADATNWLCRDGKAIGRVCVFCIREQHRARWHSANPDARYNVRLAEARGYDIPEGAPVIPVMERKEQIRRNKLARYMQKHGLMEKLPNS